MTEYEALAYEILKGNTENITEEGWQIVVDALLKQAPKPVSWEIDRTWGKATKVPVCPVCDAYLTPHSFVGFEDKEKVSWCESCGHKVSWEDEND